MTHIEALQKVIELQEEKIRALEAKLLSPFPQGLAINSQQISPQIHQLQHGGSSSYPQLANQCIQGSR